MIPEPYFDPVDTKIDFAKEEEKILKDWYKKGIVKKYLQRNKNSKKIFSFLDGPITANNPMGVHHAWGRTYKDLWQRFKNMRGFKQRFQNGFDAQGLWVEVEVEKELGFKNKKEIEKFGVEKFVQLCRDRVKKYSGVQTEQSKRLGYFMDWDNSYFTLSDDNNYMIWHFLKTCHENGWLYKGNDSVPWCPRCETAISQHEMLTEDYREVTHESVYLAFPVEDSNEYLLVWTTTPWTIPANISIAVDSTLTYSLVDHQGKKYWLAKDAIARVFGTEKPKVLKTAKGSELVGLKYRGAFDDLPRVLEIAEKFSEKFHTVVATDPQILTVTTDEGTGLVHTAVSAGTEDFKLGQKLGLPMIPVIEDDASYQKDLGFLSGQNAKKNPGIILDYLVKLNEEGKHFYLKVEKYKHRYPACWRCKSELVWKVTDEWYISMDKPLHKTINNKQNLADSVGKQKTRINKDNTNQRTLRERMIAVAKKIKWMPEFGLERELDWLNNMHDWLISKKNRYWGLALPIWECDKCGNFEVIGSKDELKTKAVAGWSEFKEKTPHKPQIDKVKIKCSKCGNVISRIEPVGNPWLDAGIVAFSTISENNKAADFEVTSTKPLYLENKSEWRRWFPADFITESFPGQFKNWFYSLIAMSTVLEDENPFKTVLGFGTLLAEDGRPMHKSWGNAIEFNEGAEKIGVDVMRWMYARQNPADNLLFGYKTADEVRRQFHIKIWNVYNYFVTYANLDSWTPYRNRETTHSTSSGPSALSSGSKRLMSSKVEASKIKSKNVLDLWIISRLSQTADTVTKKLELYDSQSATAALEVFVDDLSNWYVRRSRERTGNTAISDNDKNSFYETTYYVLTSLTRLMAPFTPFITELIYKNLTKMESVHLDEWPVVTHKVNQKLIGEMKMIREVVEVVHSIRKREGIAVRMPLLSLFYSFSLGSENYDPLEYIDLLKEELNVKDVYWGKTPHQPVHKGHWSSEIISKSEGYGDIFVSLQVDITPELEEEAKARELIRQIQQKRKELGVSLTQSVKVKNSWLPGDENLLKKIKTVTLSGSLEPGDFEVRVE